MVDADFVLDGLVFPLLGRKSVKVDCKSRFALQNTTSSLEKLRFFQTVKKGSAEGSQNYFLSNAIKMSTE